MRTKESEYTGRKDIVLALLCSGISLVIYIRTLCPTVYVVGSGELISATYFLGIAHPTGYPLYCLIGKAFVSIFPFGSPALKLNLLSALFASCTIGLMFLLLVKVVGSRWVSWTASLLFAFSRTFWSQAIIAEVYTLNALFIVLILYLLVRQEKYHQPKSLFSIAFIVGMALTNHLTFVLLMPCVALFLCLLFRDFRSPADIAISSETNRTGFDIRYIVSVFLVMALPLTFYLYLPLRSSSGSPFVWTPIETFRDLFYHVSAREYSGRLLSLPLRAVIRNLLITYPNLSIAQFSPYLIPFVFIGLIINWIKQSRTAVLFSLIFIVNVAFSINYKISDIEVFFIPSFLIMALWIGYALSYIVSWITYHIASTARHLRIAKGVFLSIILILLPLVALSYNFRANDLSSNWVAHRYGEDILRWLDRDSVIFPEGDDATFILTYLQTVENIRPDVVIYGRGNKSFWKIFDADYPRMTARQKDPILQKAALRAVLSEKRTVYFTYPKVLLFMPGYEVVPDGLVYRVRKIGQDVSAKKDFWASCRLDSLDQLPFYKDRWVKKLIANYHYAKAEALIAKGSRNKALLEYRTAGRVADDSPTMQYNLGVIFFKMGREEEAEIEFRKTVELDPAFTAAFIGLGKIKENRRLFDEADEYYRKAIDSARKNKLELANAYNASGILYAKEGLYHLAQEQWLKALKADPDHVNAKANLVKLRYTY